MMRFPTRRHSLLAAAVAAVLALGAVAPAQAQSAQERKAARQAEKEARKKGGGETKQEQLYPNATRQSPEARASNKGGPKLQKVIDKFNEDAFAEARTMADELLANSAMNPYEQAFSAQMAAQAAYSMDDNAAAIAYLNKAIELNALDNNNHFNAMLMRAQMQLSDDATLAQGLASIDQFLTESGSTNPDHLALKGQALYQLEKHAEAAEIFKKLVDTTPEPKDQWLSLLMSSYADLGKTDEAVALAERLAAKDPADKKKQMNLAAVYSQADKFDKAAAVLEKLRAAGQLTEERDYKVLYSTYLNMEGREKDVATVIDEGLSKGVLKPEYQVYLALAQSYYFSEQNAPAIDAYRKAAPLAPDGETYLNLARLLWQEDRIPEAKEAAKQAMAKGLKKPDDAKKILALPAK